MGERRDHIAAAVTSVPVTMNNAAKRFTRPSGYAWHLAVRKVLPVAVPCVRRLCGARTFCEREAARLESTNFRSLRELTLVPKPNPSPPLGLDFGPSDAACRVCRAPHQSTTPEVEVVTLVGVRGDRKIRYACVQDADVAFQVFGDGPVDLLLIPGMMNHIESAETVPEVADHYERLARFARVVLYDKRGTGLSGPLAAGGSPTIEARVDEAVAVLEAAGSTSAAVYATADGGPVGIVLAAMHPDRVQHLAVYGSSARVLAASDYPEGLPAEFAAPAVLERAFRGWGDDEDPSFLDSLVPSHGDDATVRRAVAGMQRLAGSPRAAQRYWQVGVDTDVRDVLSTVRVPTLVLHVRGDRVFPVAQGRYLAREIPDAQYVELEGDDHYYFWEAANRVGDELETFITGRRAVRPRDRRFAIILFTDIVESTRRLAEIGDDRWRSLLERHAALVGSVVPQYGGRVVKSTGDGIIATFDGPSRAALCARRLVEDLGAAGIKIRAGLHAGEVEEVGDDVAGIAVHIAARVCSLATAQEVLTTSTMRDLTAGSDIAFVDHGESELRGVPGRWSIYAVAP